MLSYTQAREPRKRIHTSSMTEQSSRRTFRKNPSESYQNRQAKKETLVLCQGSTMPRYIPWSITSGFSISGRSTQIRWLVLSRTACSTGQPLNRRNRPEANPRRLQRETTARRSPQPNLARARNIARTMTRFLILRVRLAVEWLVRFRLLSGHYLCIIFPGRSLDSGLSVMLLCPSTYHTLPGNRSLQIVLIYFTISQQYKLIGVVIVSLF